MSRLLTLALITLLSTCVRAQNSPVLNQSILSTDQGATPETGDGTAGNERAVLIGEVVDMELVIDVPEGAILFPTISLVLGEGFDLVSNSISVDGATLVFVDEGNDEVEVLLANLVNSPSTSGDEQVTVTYRVRTANAASTSDESLLLIGADLSATGVSASANDVRFRAAVPDINFSYTTFTNFTQAGNLPPSMDAGDEYGIRATLANEGTGPVYDVTLVVDIIGSPAQYFSGAITTGLTAGVSRQLSGSDNNQKFTFLVDSIAAGQTITVNYNIRIDDDAIAGETWTSLAALDYASLRDGATGRRTGDGTGANNLFATGETETYSILPPTQTVTPVHPDFTPTTDAVTQTYDDSSSDAGTGTRTVNGNQLVELTIGETVETDIVITFAEGATEDYFQALITRPDNNLNVGREKQVLEILSVEVLHVGANLTANRGNLPVVGDFLTLRDQVVDGDPDQVLTSGNVSFTNAPDNVVDVKDQIVYRITLRMDDEDESGGSADQLDGVANDVNETNGNDRWAALRSQLTYDNPVQVTGDNLVKDFYLVEPAVDITNCVTFNSGLGTITDCDLDEAVAGDRQQVTVTLTNSGDAPAYGVAFTEVMPDELDFLSIFAPNAINNSSGQTVSVFVPVIAAGGSYAFRYTVEVTGLIASATAATVGGNASYSSLPFTTASDNRNYDGVNDEVITATINTAPCRVTITNIENEPEGCPNDADGRIVVTANTNTVGTLQYALSKGVVTGTNTTGTFSGLQDGTWSLLITNLAADGCTVAEPTIVIATQDLTAPTVVCNPTTVLLDELGMGTLDVAAATAGTSDDCTANPTITAARTTFSCDDLGTFTVLVKADDRNGNTSDCLLSVTVAEGPETDCVALPLELLSFSGRTEGKHNVLQWAVRDVVAFSHFELQRSLTGRYNWFSIATLDEENTTSASETTGQSYRYRDSESPSVAYYRLRMVDLDGSASFSQVILLEQERGVGLSVYPNPSTGNFVVELPPEQTDRGGMLSITDPFGRLVQKQLLEQSQTMISAELTPGVYLLTVTVGKRQSVTRLVVN